MKTFAWNSEKNELLKAERGISFEEVALNIQLGNEVDIFEHPNQERYPGQKISVGKWEAGTGLPLHAERTPSILPSVP